jgi:hypothetical protein
MPAYASRWPLRLVSLPGPHGHGCSCLGPLIERSAPPSSTAATAAGADPQTANSGQRQPWRSASRRSPAGRVRPLTFRRAHQ